MRFDCGNRTEDCDNETTCPCLNFIQKEIETYNNGLKSDLWKKIENETIKNKPSIIKFVDGSEISIIKSNDIKRSNNAIVKIID